MVGIIVVTNRPDFRDKATAELSAFRYHIVTPTDFQMPLEGTLVIVDALSLDDHAYRAIEMMPKPERRIAVGDRKLSNKLAKRHVPEDYDLSSLINDQ